MLLRRKNRRDTREDLEDAKRSLGQAKSDNTTQQLKREQEKDSVIARIDKLAADNHLAQLVLKAFTERRSE